jgi:hypothetical protein
MDHVRTLPPVMAGAVAGLAATALMSVLMLAARAAGVAPKLPPTKIADDAIQAATDRPATPEEERVVAPVAHFAFGAGAGAAFGLAAGALRIGGSVPATLAGIAFGSAVYLVSYQGWIPALGILPPASRDDRGRVATMVGAHWVYGAVLGLVTSRLRRR